MRIETMGDVGFVRCGSVVVAPKSNVYALTCLYCRDVFKQIQVFVRHLHKEHNHQLGFAKLEKEVDVYTVEELLDEHRPSTDEHGNECGRNVEDVYRSFGRTVEDGRAENVGLQVEQIGLASICGDETALRLSLNDVVLLGEDCANQEDRCGEAKLDHEIENGANPKAPEEENILEGHQSQRTNIWLTRKVGETPTKLQPNKIKYSAKYAKTNFKAKVLNKKIGDQVERKPVKAQILTESTNGSTSQRFNTKPSSRSNKGGLKLNSQQFQGQQSVDEDNLTEPFGERTFNQETPSSKGQASTSNKENMDFMSKSHNSHLEDSRRIQYEIKSERFSSESIRKKAVVEKIGIWSLNETNLGNSKFKVIDCNLLQDPIVNAEASNVVSRELTEDTSESEAIRQTRSNRETVEIEKQSESGIKSKNINKISAERDARKRQSGVGSSRVSNRIIKSVKRGPQKVDEIVSGLRKRKASTNSLPSTAKITRYPNRTNPETNSDNHAAYKRKVLQRARSIKKQILKVLVDDKVDHKQSILNTRAASNSNILVTNAVISIQRNFKEETPMSSKTKENGEKVSCCRRVDVKKSNLEANEKTKRTFVEAANLETTNLDLSESVVEFLEHNLNGNKLITENILNEGMLVDNSLDLLNTTKYEKLAAATINGRLNAKEALVNAGDFLESSLDDDILVQNSKRTCQAESANEQREVITKNFVSDADIKILNRVGLIIVKKPEIEEGLPLEQVENMREKAKTFSKIFAQFPTVWNSKASELKSYNKDLAESFYGLKVQTKSVLSEDFLISGMKRLVNMITNWYFLSCHRKLVEKKHPSTSVENYLKLFSYIPKISRRIFYCEYCEEHFTLPDKYLSHRAIHESTHKGGLSESDSEIKLSYSCSKCHKWFTEQTLGIHSCNECLICGQCFASPFQLYEHSKTHLVTVYSCGKCELVFATATDAQRHMKMCECGRIPKNVA